MARECHTTLHGRNFVWQPFLIFFLITLPFVLIKENEAVEFDYCASIGNSYKLVREGVARSVFTASSAPLSDSVEVVCMF